jgi:hypothetical protein
MMKRKILLVIVIILVAIQFIRPSRNVAPEGAVQANDINKTVAVPADVQKILEVSCYDCHSNNTHYPWYTNIQPVGWWMQNHVNEGKHRLNFNEFTTYNEKQKDRKMKGVAESVENGSMPLPSYLIIHKDAKLSDDQKKRLIQWAESLSGAVATSHP